MAAEQKVRDRRGEGREVAVAAELKASNSVGLPKRPACAPVLNIQNAWVRFDVASFVKKSSYLPVSRLECRDTGRSRPASTVEPKVP